MKVSQYMTRPVVTISPDTEFHRAFDLMRSRRIHHLPVVEDGLVVGIVAERDLLLAAANYGPAELPVGEIMHSPPVCVSAGAELKEAARLLVVEHIGSLPVLDARKALVGIITETDIFKVTAGMLRPRRAAKKPVKQSAGKRAGKSVRAVAKKAVKKAPKKAVKKAPKKAAAKSAGTGGRTRAR